VENYEIIASDVDIVNNTLVLALAGGDGMHYRVTIGLQRETERTAQVLGSSSVRDLVGRCVRGVKEGDRIVNLCNIIQDIWLIQAQEEEQTEAEKCEMDIHTEP